MESYIHTNEADGLLILRYLNFECTIKINRGYQQFQSLSKLFHLIN